MIKGTILPFRAKFGLGAGFGHPDHGMKIIFFPSVAFFAVEAFGTAIFVVDNEIRALPKHALYIFLIRDTWFSSKILPIMSVDTSTLIMLLLVKGTHHGFVVENKKIRIHCIFVNQLDRYFTFAVGK